MAQIILPEGAAAATPAAGYSVIYPKADGLWYSKDDAGNEYQLSGVQTTGLVTVAPASAPDIFGAAGATINLSGAAVTITSFTACTSAQVGSVKRVIPAANANVTASANLIVDGATSGTIVMPAGARLVVLATSTTTFEITTITARGTWTPSGFTGGGTGITYSGKFIKRNGMVRLDFVIIGTGLTTTAGSTTLSGVPFMPNADNIGNLGVCVNGGTNQSGVIQAYNDGKIYFAVSISSTTQIIGSVEYYV